MNLLLKYLLGVLLFSGCSIQYTQHQAKTIVFKTPTFKYADAGFIHTNKDDVHVEILMAGHHTLDLLIGRKICFNSKCMKPKEFNAIYLSTHYTDDLLKNIFLGQPIFKSKFLVKKSIGFEQHIVRKDFYNIVYKVNDKTIYFKDKYSNILIKIKKL